MREGDANVSERMRLHNSALNPLSVICNHRLLRVHLLGTAWHLRKSRIHFEISSQRASSILQLVRVFHLGDCLHRGIQGASQTRRTLRHCRRSRNHMHPLRSVNLPFGLFGTCRFDSRVSLDNAVGLPWAESRGIDVYVGAVLQQNKRWIRFARYIHKLCDRIPALLPIFHRQSQQQRLNVASRSGHRCGTHGPSAHLLLFLPTRALHRRRKRRGARQAGIEAPPPRNSPPAKPSRGRNCPERSMPCLLG